MNHQAFILAGATASGKTSVVHYLAQAHGATILSADSMLVYKGMDIGTAKPTLAERSQVPYFGLDCVEPGQTFNTAQWLDSLKGAPALERPLYVTGGTGLYIKSLIHGLDPSCEVPADLRERLSSATPEALRTILTNAGIDPGQALADPANPRRLQRAAELTLLGQPIPSRWRELQPSPILALRYPRETLHQRIAQRVDQMYEMGLLEETTRLLDTYPLWSNTAQKAIGYAEAIACISGDMTLAQAKERTIIRTRQLARRQETWLNHQTLVTWITPTTTDSLDTIAQIVFESWRHHAPTPITL